MGVNYADFTWDNIVSLAKLRVMKIKRGANGSMPLSGFGLLTMADPQPGVATLTIPPIPTESTQVQAFMMEHVFQTTAPAPTPVAESKKFDLELSTPNGEELSVWPCPLCTLVGRTESAHTYPL